MWQVGKKIAAWVEIWLFCFENSLSNIGTYCVTRPTTADKKTFFIQNMSCFDFCSRDPHISYIR